MTGPGPTGIAGLDIYRGCHAPFLDFGSAIMFHVSPSSMSRIQHSLDKYIVPEQQRRDKEP